MGETLLLHATRYGYVQQSIFDAATTQIASQQQQQQQCLKCCCVIYVQQDRDKLKEITMCSVQVLWQRGELTLSHPAWTRPVASSACSIGTRAPAAPTVAGYVSR